MTTARRGTTAARTSAAVVLGVLIALVALSVVSAPAAEAASYRYWTYWSGERPGTSAAWTFSSRGPATDVVKDGTVIGWRFAVTSQAGTTKPRASASLATLCPDLADPVADRTRVALVVDYGTASDAPPGQQPPLTDRVRVECLTVAGSRVTGATVLDAAGIAVRTENGLLCALDSYPRGECAPVVGSSTRPTASPSPKPTTSTSAAAKPGTTRTSASATSTSSPAPAPTRSSSAAPSTSSTASAAVVPPVSSSPTSTGPTPDETLPAVAGAPAAAEPEQSSAAGFVGGALLVAGIGAAAWWTSRRRGAA